MSSEINQRVRKCRKEKKIKQYQVAEKMGLKITTYSQMEREGNISGERLVLLAEILGVSTEYLLYGKENNDDTLNFSKTSEKEPNLFKEPSFYNNENNSDDDDYFPVTPNEISIITILRNFPKDVKKEVISYIEKRYKETK